MTRQFSIPAIFTATLLLGGCMVGPDFVRPEAPYLDSWTQGSSGLPVNSKTGFTSRSEAVADWWTLFKDPTLNAFVNEAYQQNLQLEAAGARVYQARAQLGIARGELFPQQQQGFANGKYLSISKNDPFVQEAERFVDINTEFTRYQVGFDAGWEIDIWGKIRRDVQSAKANLAAKIASYDDVLVTLTGDIAATYVTVRELQALISVARSNAALQKKSLDIAKLKFENGTTTELDIDEATARYNDTLSIIPELEGELAEAYNAMSVLLGETPGKIKPRMEKKYGRMPVIPAQAAVGVPADMLRRRPDIRAAEYRAAAQSAQIGVAQADLYPAFTISGAIAVNSKEVATLFTKNSFDAFINPGFTWNFLNYGRIRNNVRAQDAKFQELLLDYENTVLKAYAEVETSITAFFKAKQQTVYLYRSVKAAKDAEARVLDQYRDGTAGYDRVLDAQRQIFTSESRLVSARADVLTNLIAIYKGIAGGWIPPNVKGFVNDKTRQQMDERTNWGKLLESAPDGVDQPES